MSMVNPKGWRPEGERKGIYVEPHAQTRMCERFPELVNSLNKVRLVTLIQALVYDGYWYEPNGDASASWLVESVHAYTRTVVYIRCCWDPDGKVRVKTIMSADQCQVFPEGATR